MDNLAPTGLSRVLRLFWTSGYDYKTCRRAAKESEIQPVAFEFFILRWAAKVTKVSSYQAAGIPIRCVKYENLISDPYRTVCRFFSHVGVSLHLVDTALQAMERDSHTGLQFSKENRKNHPGWVETEAAIRRCNKVLQVFKLPDLQSDYVMVGTLSKLELCSPTYTN